MNKELIERMAREAGMGHIRRDADIRHGQDESIASLEDLECFATLIAEECAKIAESMVRDQWEAGTRNAGPEEIAAAIRETFKP